MASVGDAARPGTTPSDGAMQAAAFDGGVRGSREAGAGQGSNLDARTREAPHDAATSGNSSGEGGVSGRCSAVGPVPDEVRQRLKLDAFYMKHVDAEGLPVLSSAAPDDRSLTLACELLNTLLQKRADVRKELIRRGARFVIIGEREGTAEVPEYGYREKSQAERDMINQRARGLGGQVASCGEENILCLRGDRYANESICLHEFSHTITTYGAYGVDRSFQQRLQTAYEGARDRGILDDTYRKENAQEYWAEGAQDWFDTNASANPSNGIHNQVNTQSELQGFDPALYTLLGELFPTDARWSDCHVRR